MTEATSPSALDALLATLRVDALLLGVHGLDADAGLTTPNLLEAETNRALVRAAGRVVVVTDSSSWGTVGLGRFGSLDDIDVLVIAEVSEPMIAAINGSAIGAGLDLAMMCDLRIAVKDARMAESFEAVFFKSAGVGF